MKNWKTTLAGVVAGFGTIGTFFGIPHEVAQAISTLGVFLLGVFAKDLNVTGGTTAQ